jgi:cytochrome c556
MKLLAVPLIVLALTQVTAPPARPVPVAANTLADNPDSYAGQIVSVTASVDRVLSPSTFVVDQDPARSAAHELLVIVPTLSGPIEPNAYLTIVGEVLRFDAADIALRAKDYKLDLSPEIVARYKGRPAILATAVVNAAFVDLAKVPPPPLTPEEEAFDKVMKRVGPAFNELRAAAAASNAAEVAERAKALRAAFAEAEAFWKARKAADAIEWTRTARTHLTALERAAAAGRWDQVKTSVADVNRMCSTCHTAYRERLEDGTYRVKTR